MIDISIWCFVRRCALGSGLMNIGPYWTAFQFSQRWENDYLGCKWKSRAAINFSLWFLAQKRKQRYQGPHSSLSPFQVQVFFNLLTICNCQLFLLLLDPNWTISVKSKATLLMALISLRMDPDRGEDGPWHLQVVGTFGTLFYMMFWEAKLLFV